MQKIIALIFLTVFSFITITNAQSSTIEIVWDNTVVNPNNLKTQESFKEATYIESNKFSPIYSKWFSINGNEADVVFTNLVFEEFEATGADFNHLTNNVEFKTQIAFEKKVPSLLITCIPLRKNQFSGKIEKLVSFDIDINATSTFQTKSLKATKPNSVLASGKWHKISVANDGVFKIDKTFLNENNIASQNISFSSFGVFGQAMGILPEANQDTRIDDLEEIPIKIVDQNNNGSWDDNDYVLFYGKGPHVWDYDKSIDNWEHIVNIYTDVNGYFITTTNGTGLSLQSVTSLTGANINTSTYTFRDFFEEEIYNLMHSELGTTSGSGRKWLGEKLSSFNNTQSFNLNVPNIVNGTLAQLKLSVAARSSASSTFSLKNNGIQLFNVGAPAISSSSAYPSAGSAGYAVKNAALSSINNFELVFNNNDPQANGFLNYLDVIAKANLKLDASYLIFRDTESVDAGNKTKFTISNSNGNTEIWDITQGTNVFKINGNLNGTQYDFTVATDTLREFVAVNKNASFSSPFYNGTITNQNLHGLAQQDMFIITTDKLSEAANKIANFHREEGLSVAVVDVQKIYNEFSSGQQDLTAIRDFLKMFYDRATNFASMPKYALLLGDASFDYKDRIDNNTNLIPTYQSPESYSQTLSYCTDDYIGFLDDNEGADITDTSNPNKVDIAIGRIPVTTLAEANGVANKIINYNTNATQNDWRNVLCFVADDEDNNLHFTQVEELSSLTSMENADDYNIEKIYVDAFDQVNGAGGDRYPDVNDVILRKLRTGAFLINYTGHGGPKNWAQERVFNIEDIRALKNIDNLPLFITATCDFSPYDDAEFHSAGETLISNAEGGAIALITTTRLVYAHQNKIMNAAVLNYLFQEYQGRMPTVGEILVQAKNSAIASENNRKFVLLGDPALTLAYPKHEVVTTKINDLPISQIDTLKALSKVKIEGEIRNESGVLLNNFNGVVYPSVYDKIGVYQTKGQDSDSQIDTFNLRNKILFKGKASVINGKFSFEFIVPKDINYALDYGKISYYAASSIGEEDAQGYTYDFIVGGTSDSIIADDNGPLIDVFINDSTFAFGGLTDENPILLVNLRDNSGINTVGNGVGHDIIGLLNENTQQQYSLNDFYSAKLDDYTQGNIEYPFNKLDDGRYGIRVKAWDVHNNPGEGYTEFIVASSAEIALQNVFNYPNPFTTHTSFIFEHNRPGELLDVNVQIFTVSGKLVKSIFRTLSTDGYSVKPNEITWDGLDDYGDLIGRGVYIYKVNVQGENGFNAQEFEKLVILR